MNKKMLLGAGLAVSLFGVAACGDASEDAGQEPTSSQEQTEEQTEEQGGEQQGGEGQAPEQPQAPEPDLEGIPEVVAEVNGQEIGKEEFVSAYEGQFQQMAMQSQMSGQEVDQDQLKQQMAESLVGTELLVQEADNREFQASQEDIEATLQELAQSNGMESGDDFMAALGEQGMDEEEVMSQLQTQVKVDQLVAEEAGDTEPTEAELRELYDQAAAQQEQAAGQGGEGGESGEMPPFEEVKPQLEQRIKSQKEGQAAQALVGELRESADVTIHL